VEHRRDQLAWNLHSTHTQEGDIVELVGLRHKHFLVQLKQDAIFQSHRGIIKHADLLGLPWGSQVLSHLGSPFFVIQPSLGDLLRETRRQTQILYPKDIGFLMVTMGIGPGQHIIEAGTGSGALTTALAFSVGKEGKVFSYDMREDFQKLAKENLTRVGLDDRVTFKIGDIANGFDETDADALFLDVPNPFDYMVQVKKALRPGGFFGCILPTTNQVSILLTALRHELFAFIDVCEVMLRYYQAEADRFRPTDRMVAHTGYLIFARPVLPGMGGVDKDLLIENTTDNSLEQL
jgi:tRNA (adenine57-N1/adenine58-N1)-methyltransferase catalytic subunit